MDTKTNIHILGLVALVGVMAGVTVPVAFAEPDEFAISDPAISTNIFLCGTDNLDPFGMDSYWYDSFGYDSDWYDLAQGELSYTSEQDEKLEAELDILDAAYERLFDEFYPETVLTETQQAEFDATLSALDAEFDAILTKLGVTLAEDKNTDIWQLLSTLTALDAKYDQLYDKFYPEVVLSEEQQAEFDARLKALDYVYNAILIKHEVSSELLWFDEGDKDWHVESMLGMDRDNRGADDHMEGSAEH